MRSLGRKNDELRPVIVETGFQPAADASLLIKMGNTHVACGVTIEEEVPSFLKDKGRGWITAEYGMLPLATHTRSNREAVRGRSGRTYEIQRLIGRSLRMMVDLAELGENTLRVDCDVINADGGTRCASITGAALALRAAFQLLKDRRMIAELPEIVPIAGVSVGLRNGEILLDLDYEEDSSCEADANFVMTEDGRLIEIQCTAEKGPVTRSQFEAMELMAAQGMKKLFALWR
jgi:ribonuclease PH